MSKAKYALHFCVSCNKETKMEEIGSMEGIENKRWFRCTRCRHSSMFDLEPKKSAANMIKVNRDDCISYTPERIYTVGECIYHTDWDDIGKITGKEKTSSGAQAIVVSFEKNGSRRLIENLPAEA
jgi:DNA-directed RNA polymerase subunit RPC12/RpoP